MSDNRLRLVFVGTDKKKIQRLESVAEDRFEAEGFDVVWRSPYPNVEFHDIQAALEDTDMERKNCEWLRSIPSDTITDLLNATTGPEPTIRGWGLIAEPDTTLDWYDIADDILDALNNDGTVQYEVVSTTPYETPVGAQKRAKNPNAPFSYDPSQSYYTEPDRD